MYQDRFSTAATPPRPVVRPFRVFNRRLDWEALFDEAIVDTGSDLSFIPRNNYGDLLNAAELAEIPLDADIARIVGMTGEERQAPLVLLSFGIPGLGLELSATFVLYGLHAIIGRNILNSFNVYLEGVPARSSESPTLRIDRI